MHQGNTNKHLLSIAPMMDITYEPFRVMFRYLTKQATLYTEMYHERAIHQNSEYLRFSEVEHPIVVQLGGNDIQKLAEAAKICKSFGYDEINLNVGCPSERVQDGAFGACLMKEADLVADIMRKMQETVDIPVTVKCRLGVDEYDSYEFAYNFVKRVSEQGGVNHFIIHARKAILKGLNPSENRTIPPLKYDYVFKLKRDFPHLQFTINGGIKTLDHAKELIEQGLDGVMMGRAAYDNPWIFSDVDRKIYCTENQNFSRREILLNYGKDMDLLREQKTFKASYPMLVKPIVSLFNGETNNRTFRHFVSSVETQRKYPLFSDFIKAAVLVMEGANPKALDARPNDTFI